MGISLNGKCAIVTGAANGVGLAIAQTFVSAGAKVVLSDMDEDNLTQETNSLADKNEGKVFAFCGDLRKKLTIKNSDSNTTIRRFSRKLRCSNTG